MTTKQRQFEVGDRVTWLQSSAKGHTVSLRTIEEEVTGISGNTISVKYGRKESDKKLILASKLRFKGKKTWLSEIVETVTASVRGNQEGTPSQ